MSRKQTPKPDNPDQSKRFIDMAREVEADEGDGAFDRAFKKVVGPKSKGSTPKTGSRGGS